MPGSIGTTALIGALSYAAFGRETVAGTYNTCTAGLDFLSFSFKTTKDAKILEQVERSRTHSKQFQLGKVVEGEMEYYYDPMSDGCNFQLQNAFGGTITSATSTGETVGAGANSGITHTFNVGSMDQSYPSMCINARYGPVTTGRIWQYSGTRIDEITFKAELDEPLMTSVKAICFDSTLVTNDVESALTVTANQPLSFVDGRLSVEGTLASLTTSSIWHIQSAELSMKNSLKGDKESRRIGSDTLVVLPPTILEITLKCTIRFDTTTAYSAMINGTEFAAALQFQGSTFTSSAIRRGLLFNMPSVYIKNATEPEISGPDEILTSEVEFNVLRDDSSNTGYAIQALVTNQRANYS